MSTLSWNCRGAGGPRKLQFLQQILRSTGANLAFVSETKCSFIKSKRVLQPIPLLNHFIIPSVGRSGGLWLLWDDNTCVTVLRHNRFMIYAEITPTKQPQWHLVCVYGDPGHQRNPEIWADIAYLVRHYERVAVVGDFNAVAHQSEKFGGDPDWNTNNRRFRKFISDAGLIDLGFKGPAYTWKNNQGTSTEIYQRLDRVLATVQWLQQFPCAYVNHMPRMYSDHAPILLRMSQKIHNNRQFRVEKWWMNTDGFYESWQAEWEET